MENDEPFDCLDAAVIKLSRLYDEIAIAEGRTSKNERAPLTGGKVAGLLAQEAD